MVLFNCQELDCWLGWSPTVCKCSYKHWLGWQVLTAESARNLEIHHLGLFVGDNESQLPWTLILVFQKFSSFSFIRTRAFFRLPWNGCSTSCSYSSLYSSIFSSPYPSLSFPLLPTRSSGTKWYFWAANSLQAARLSSFWKNEETTELKACPDRIQGAFTVVKFFSKSCCLFGAAVQWLFFNKSFNFTWAYL